eukprot:gene201-243_t
MCHSSPLVTISIPSVIPPSVEGVTADTIVAFVSINDNAQLMNFKSLITGKTIGGRKLTAELFEIKPLNQLQKNTPPPPAPVVVKKAPVVVAAKVTPVVAKAVAPVVAKEKPVVVEAEKKKVVVAAVEKPVVAAVVEKEKTSVAKAVAPVVEKKPIVVEAEKKKVVVEQVKEKKPVVVEAEKKDKKIVNTGDNQDIDTRDKKKQKVDKPKETSTTTTAETKTEDKATAVATASKPVVVSTPAPAPAEVSAPATTAPVVTKSKFSTVEGKKVEGSKPLTREEIYAAKKQAVMANNPFAEVPQAPLVRNNKKVILKITQQLVFFSEKKDYPMLVRSYQYLKRIGAKPDHIAYGVMLNACVRCREFDMVREVFEDAVKSAVGGNDVIYTTYIKALCETDMAEAERTIARMREAKVPPNVRSYNSILRGCLRSGDVEIAIRLYNEMSQVPELHDSTTIEYLIKIYSQHLRIADCWTLLGDKFESMQNEISPIVFSRLALASLLAGDLKSSIRALTIIDDLMAKAPQSIANSTSHKNKGKLSDKNKVSANLFERINRREIDEESERVRGHLEQLSKQKNKLKCTNMENSKRVYFSPVTFKNLYETIPEMKENTSFQDNLFSERSKKSDRQLKMEICSGHGHWIMKRAAQDLDADWLSVEIRYDRVFQIWSKLTLESIDNLYVMGGEAHSVIKNTVPKEVLDEVYINYPNPPVWENAARLIDHDFLVEINRTLKHDGTLTIVTDDQAYAESVVHILRQSKKLARIFKPVKQDYICNLDEDYGDSYFNKLWTNGQRMKRYCVYVIKDMTGQ